MIAKGCMTSSKHFISKEFLIAELSPFVTPEETRLVPILHCLRSDNFSGILDLIEFQITKTYNMIQSQWKSVTSWQLSMYAIIRITQAYAQFYLKDMIGGVRSLDYCLIVTGGDKYINIIHGAIEEAQKEIATVCLSEELKLSFEFKEILLEAAIGRLSYKNCNLSQILYENLPCYIEDFVTEWPAYTKWPKIDGFIKNHGHRLVPIEIGRSYTSTEWKITIMTMSEFIKEYLLSNEAKIGYMAQHDLFHQIPSLEKDINYPFSLSTDNCICKAWIGTCGTITPLHNDPYHNLFAQVVGYKKIRLYNPKYSVDLLPFPKGSKMENTSQIQIESLSYEEHSQLKEIPYFEFILKPVQLLYIPPEWWHFVEAKTTSFSVSFWW